MKISHWQSFKDENLVVALRDLSREGLNLRFQRAHGQLEKFARIGEVRKDIARIKLLLSIRKKDAEKKKQEKKDK